VEESFLNKKKQQRINFHCRVALLVKFIFVEQVDDKDGSLENKNENYEAGIRDGMNNDGG
jgi:hypothetical protein